MEGATVNYRVPKGGEDMCMRASSWWPPCISMLRLNVGPGMIRLRSHMLRTSLHEQLVNLSKLASAT